jgi:hypothetical protein
MQGGWAQGQEGNQDDACSKTLCDGMTELE